MPAERGPISAIEAEHRAAAKLVDELEVARQEMARTRDEALRLARMKSEFLATMSHEIRTPLNGIAGVLELMTSAKSERIPQLVDMAKLSADSLLDIVTEVLDLSRLEYGQSFGAR